MTFRGLRLLLGVHAALTFAAGVVLVAAPSAIPSTVGIVIEPRAYLVCYLLAAAELGVAVLSWGARTITDVRALRIIVMAFIVMHGATAVLEVYAFARGLGAAIWGNVLFRVLVIALFGYYGRETFSSAGKKQ